MKNVFIALIALTTLHVQGQVEELNQRTQLFISEVENRFKVKSINGSEPDYGVLPETEFVEHEYLSLIHI